MILFFQILDLLDFILLDFKFLTGRSHDLCFPVTCHKQKYDDDEEEEDEEDDGSVGDNTLGDDESDPPPVSRPLAPSALPDVPYTRESSSGSQIC